MHNVALLSRAYTPYGHSALRRGHLGFNGELQDELTGLYPLGNGYRGYSPTLMRFHSPDTRSPFDTGGLNPYSYCLGDPVNLTDPSGRSPGLFERFESWLQPGKKLAASTWDLTRKSLLPHPSNSKQGFLEGRYAIHDYRRKISSGTPFIDKLVKVNSNLASHGDASLSPAHAEAYINIAQRTKSGSLSNTSAHLLASQEWMKEQGPTRLVGTAFNLGGALVAGGEDHALMKTGKSLQVVQRVIRDGIADA